MKRVIIAVCALGTWFAHTNQAHAQLMRLTAEAGTSKPLTPGNFSSFCRDNEALVGIFGRAKTFVDQIGGYCVKLKSNGAWDGEVRAIGPDGGGGGNGYDRKCDRNHAIYAFRGRAALYVDQIEIRCKPLTSSTTVSGTAYYKSPVGGPGGNAFGPFTCQNSRPALGWVGQAVSFVDAIRLACKA